MATFFDRKYFKHLTVRTIYRSSSGGWFFISFNEDQACEDHSIRTLYNQFCINIACTPTIWNPTFEQKKILLVIGLDVGENFSEVERDVILNSKEDLIPFGFFKFKEKKYSITIDNLNEQIRLEHIEIE